MKQGYKEYIKQFLTEQEFRIGDGKDLNITIKVSKPDKEPDIDDQYEELFNDEEQGRLSFNYDDDLEDLYKIEKSINVILNSCSCFEKIQTHNSVIDPNTEELHITITTKEDDDGITEQFYKTLKEFNEKINKITGFVYEVIESPDIVLGSNGENGKNKTVTNIKIYKGRK